MFRVTMPAANVHNMTGIQIFGQVTFWVGNIKEFDHKQEKAFEKRAAPHHHPFFFSWSTPGRKLVYIYFNGDFISLIIVTR